MLEFWAILPGSAAPAVLGVRAGREALLGAGADMTQLKASLGDGAEFSYQGEIEGENPKDHYLS